MPVILNDSEWRKFIQGMKGKLRDPFPILKLASMTYGFKDIIEHFRKEESPSGRWKPRKPSTQRAYALKGKTDARYNPSNKLLQLVGNLRESLLGDASQIRKRGRLGAELFTDVPYAHRHNEGYKTPKREFMWLSDRATERMADLVLRKVMGEF